MDASNAQTVRIKIRPTWVHLLPRITNEGNEGHFGTYTHMDDRNKGRDPAHRDRNGRISGSLVRYGDFPSDSPLKHRKIMKNDRSKKETRKIPIGPEIEVRGRVLNGAGHMRIGRIPDFW